MTEPHPAQPSDQTILRSASGWLSRPNIVGLSVGAKVVKGAATTRRALVVHVVEKKPAGALTGADFPVPAQLELEVPGPDGSTSTVSVPTDVIAVGEARLQALDQRVRPCPGGYQVDSGVTGISGTLGVNIAWRGAYRLLASNHVIAENGNVGSEVYQPRDNADDLVGTVNGYVPVVLYPKPDEPNPVFNKQDLAWSNVGKDVCAPAIYEIGAPKGIREPKVGETVRLVGKQTGAVKTAKVVSVDLQKKMKWPIGGTQFAWFTSLIQLDSVVTVAGDSGAAYVADDGMVVGLHMGANDAYSFGCLASE